MALRASRVPAAGRVALRLFTRHRPVPKSKLFWSLFLLNVAVTQLFTGAPVRATRILRAPGSSRPSSCTRCRSASVMSSGSSWRRGGPWYFPGCGPSPPMFLGEAVDKSGAFMLGVTRLTEGYRSGAYARAGAVDARDRLDHPRGAGGSGSTAAAGKLRGSSRTT
jgi:hypothetical protein